MTPEQQRNAALLSFRQASVPAMRSFNQGSADAMRRYREGTPGAMQRSREALVTNQRQMPKAINDFNRRMAIGQHNTRRFAAGRQSASDARRKQDLSNELQRRRVGGTLGGPVGGTTRTGWDGRAITMGGGTRKTIGATPTRTRPFSSPSTAGRSATLIRPNADRPGLRTRAFTGASTVNRSATLANPNRDRQSLRARPFTAASTVNRSATLANPNAARPGLRSARLFGRQRNPQTGKLESLTAGRFAELNNLRTEARRILAAGPPDPASQARLIEIRRELATAQAPGAATLIRPNAAREDRRSQAAIAGGATLIRPNEFRIDRTAKKGKAFTAASMVGRSATLADPNRDRAGLRSEKLYGKDASGRTRSKAEFDRREALKRRMRRILAAGPPRPEDAEEIAAITTELKDDGQTAAAARRTQQSSDIAATQTPATTTTSDTKTDAYRGDVGSGIGAAAVQTRGSLNGLTEKAAENTERQINDQAPDGDDAEVQTRVGNLAQEATNSADLRRATESAATTRPPLANPRATPPPLTRLAPPSNRRAETALSRMESQPRYPVLAA
jgi:hypothetical protein